MTNPLAAPFKDHYYLIDFRYGDRTNYQYLYLTDWTEDIELFHDNLYSSEPSLEVNPGKRTGDLSEGPLVLRMKRGASGLIYDMSSGEAHSPVKVVVRQVSKYAGISDQVFLFRGTVKRVTRNSGGKAGVIKIECVTWKDNIEVILGIGANARCPWTFGDPSTCKAIIGAEDGVITAIASTKVTIPGLTSHIASYWHRGSIERDGVKFVIRSWSGDDFYLSRTPPQSWLGQVVTLVEGCDKKISTCRDDKLREESFGGIGKAIPKYNPLFENPNG